MPSEPPHAARGLPDAALDLLRRQRGLVTAAQLAQVGVTREAIRWGLARRWSAPLPGVLLVGAGALDEHQRAQAALLFGGPRAVLAGPTAAARLGVRAADVLVVHVLVPPTCAARRSGWVRVHRSVVADAGARTVAGLPTCSPARAVVDAARWAQGDDQALAVVVEACQRRITTPEALADRLAAFGRAAGTARARRAVELASAGAWSVPEARLAERIATSRRLPTPWLNPRLVSTTGQRLVSPDLWFDDVALAVMVHSKAHHLIGDDWVRTVEQDGDLAAAGVVALGLTPTTIARDPAGAVLRVEQAYAAAARRPRPSVVALENTRENASIRG